MDLELKITERLMICVIEKIFPFSFGKCLGVQLDISGSDDPVILLEATDSYSETITLPEGGNYIGITGNNFTGHLEMNIE